MSLPRILGILLLALPAARPAPAAEPARFRPEDMPGLSDGERAEASFASLRFGPGPEDVLLLAFPEAAGGGLAGELVFLAPGAGRPGGPHRRPAERRRRGDDGPARFRPAIAIPLGRAAPPGLLEILEIEKRPGHGRLRATLRLSGPARDAPALLLLVEWRQTGTARVVIPQAELDPGAAPELRLRSTQLGRRLHGALRFGGWDILLDERRPAIPVQVRTGQGRVVESGELRPAGEAVERIYNWSAEFRRALPGQEYHFEARVRPGPGCPELVETLIVRIPAAVP